MFTPCVPRIARARRRRQSPFASIHRTTRVPTAPRASPATIDPSRARLPRHRARASPPAVVPRALASPRETLSRLGLPPSPAARVLPPLPRARPRARPARAVVASNEIFSRTFAPSAGPIGGAGDAFPASIASLMYPATLAAITVDRLAPRARTSRARSTAFALNALVVNTARASPSATGRVIARVAAARASRALVRGRRPRGARAADGSREHVRARGASVACVDARAAPRGSVATSSRCAARRARASRPRARRRRRRRATLEPAT